MFRFSLSIEARGSQGAWTMLPWFQPANFAVLFRYCLDAPLNFYDALVLPLSAAITKL
jgi:hypothetical protein